MADFSVTGLDHIQLAMPEGAEDIARAFFVGKLGLGEVAKPVELIGTGGCWFAGPGLNLHLGVEPGFHPAKKAHPAIGVDDLAAAQAALDGGEITALPGLRRFFCTDPFGNRIEIVERDQ